MTAKPPAMAAHLAEEPKPWSWERFISPDDESERAVIGDDLSSIGSEVDVTPTPEKPPLSLKISELRCYRCERNDRALFRVSALGEPGVWACEECLPPDKAPDPEVKEIVDIIGEPKPPSETKA